MDASRIALVLAIASLAAGAAAGDARAQEFPYKPIRFVVPGAPGGGTDAVTRILANAITQSKKWQFVVENIPGAGGNLGLEKVAKAAKDGYTLGMGESSNLIINQYLYSELPFSAETDLEPLILVAKVPLVLVVGAGSPYDSVRSLVAGAKQRSLSFASAGIGTMGHLTGERWKRRLGLDMVHVPYKSAAPAMTDVAGGQVDFFFASIASGLPFIKAGKARPLAVIARARSALLPDAPTFDELGEKDMEIYVIYGVVAPRGTPGSVIGRLNAEMNAALSRPAVRAAMSSLGAEIGASGGTPEAFASFLAEERRKWSPVVKASGAKVD